MFFMDLLGWWYGAGFKDLSIKFNSFFVATSDFFSIGDLVKSLFKPYRQTLTSVAYKRTLGQKMGDAFISRAVGFIVRSFLIFSGMLALFIQAIVMLLVFALWPFVPLLPIFLVVMSLMNFGF